jgi:flagellar hook-associated protein 2
MSTVGLNFGSPTSGAGFDVSTTVAQIVGNLQNVETPWKNQLSALQSQDTVISSLGTLYSNLSNDLSQLTELNGVLAQKTGSSSNTNVLELTSATSSATAGTHTVVVNKLAQTSSGYLAEIPNASDTLKGSITLRVGSGSTQTIALPAAGETLASLASSINSSALGVTASVLTDSSGSRLSLVSSAAGAKANLTISSNSIVDASGVKLQYTGTAGSGSTPSSGTLTAIANAADTLSGALSIQLGSGAATNFTLDASDNTLATLVNKINQSALGVTASVQTNSDGSSSLALLSNTTGSAGTLTISSSVVDVSPALAYTSTVTGSDASLTVDGVNLTSASNTVTNLIPGLTFQLLSASALQSDGTPAPVQVVIGNDNSGVETAVSTLVTDYNALVQAINTQQGNDSSGHPEPLFGSPTLSLLQQQLLSSLNAQNPNGYLDGVSTGATLSGKLLISVGGGTQHEVDVPDAPNNTINDLADAFNAANLGVTAHVATSGGESYLMFQSQLTGAAGALAVTSTVEATQTAPLAYSPSSASGTQNASGTLTTVAAAGDLLTGSLSIQLGDGTPATIALGSAGQTLQDLADAINGTANLGATASVSSDGKTLTLQAADDSGAMTVNSTLFDSTAATTTALSYTNSSDVSTLTALGISMNNDGTIALDAASLDSLLNSDFNGVVGMFQGLNSWGASVSNLLSNAGTTASTGVLKLAQTSNSKIESTLNAEIAKQESLIASQQKTLTAELNTANEILQAIPSQLSSVSELYSAITGYNQGNN